MTLGTDILREVSIHVLNTIPVKPLRYETLNPAGFLTQDANVSQAHSLNGKRMSQTRFLVGNTTWILKSE